MKHVAVFLMLIATGWADACLVLVDGAGCRTRQLAMQRIWQDLPRVRDVDILPREQAPAANQRYFVIESRGAAPTRDELVKALGRRAKHYIVLSVKPAKDSETD